MTQKLEIPISATLNTTGVEQGAKKLNDALKQVGKHKVDPVPPEAIRKIDQLFQAYLKMDREMERRLRFSGQSGVAPENINWERIYQNKNSRARKQEQLEGYLRSGGASDFRTPDHSGGGGFKKMAAGVAQAGMRAAGPAGGVAANALGTGMSAGFGAGLMGLVGGMAALGVGKLVGAIAEKVEQAENNNIAYDRLKRTLGDVNVSFTGLKKSIVMTGDSLNTTYDETAGLFSQFAKSGNVSGRAGMNAMPQEIGLGVGLSRAYGMDNGQGVGFLGQMRGVGVTKDVQDSRRIALLIGETIAKSDAFAKADEVFDAIASFATAQTRQSMSAANVGGYAGMFSSMVGSGIAGMDPAGASAILAKMNSSLASGGARGEASQFFTSMVGNRMGLDPLQMQVLREGGAFATKDQMFGKDANGNDSAYRRYMGKGHQGPSGSSNFLAETRALIEEKYAGDSEQQKLMRAQAFGNHTGLNMNQAMAMLSLQPNEMGELQKVLGNKAMSLNASGINNAAMALNGTDEQRAGIRSGLLKREDLTQDDRRTLEKLGSKDPEEQKRTLAILSAQYEQERTQGSDIRDSRAALDNIKVNIAGKVVPHLNDMRRLLVNIAGGGKKTPNEMMKELAAADEKDRTDSINEQFNSKETSLKAKRDGLIEQQTKLRKKLLSGEISREDYDKQNAALLEQISATEKSISGVGAERSAALNPVKNTGGATGSWDATDPSGAGKSKSGSGAGAAAMSKSLGPLDEKLAAADARKGFPPGTMKSLLLQESGGKQEYIDNPEKYHYPMDGNGRRVAPHTGQVSTAFGPFGILESTGKKPGYGVQPLQSKDIDEQIRFSSDYLAARSKAAGGLSGGLAGYGEGAKYSNSVIGRINAYNTPMPTGAAGGPGSNQGGTVKVQIDPLTVQHQGPQGQQVRPDQTIQTRVSAPNPVSGGATGSY